MWTYVVLSCLLCCSLLTMAEASANFTDCTVQDRSIKGYSDYFRNEVLPRSLDYWHKKVDFTNGGYEIEAGSRHIVEQSRLVWLFSSASLNGFDVYGHNNLEAARKGVDFLLSKMLDTTYGGYYWSTSKEGEVLDDRKYMYAQSFVLYGLATYYRATGDDRARVAALDLVKVICMKALDTENEFGGYYESFTRKWDVISEDYGPVAPNFEKTANFVLHWMEALSEAVIAFNEQSLKDELAITLDQSVVAFYPSNPENAVKSTNFRGDVLESGKDSYGHLVEYAWLRIEAEKAQGRELDWALFDRYFKYVVERLDSATGLVLNSEGLLPWWPQAELMAAFAVEKELRGGKVNQDSVLVNLLEYVACRFIDPVDGMFYYSLNRDGSVGDATKSNKWKVGYHSFRGISKLAKSFIYARD